MGTHEDEIVRLLAETQNRAILTHLNDVARPLSVTEVAEHLVDHDTTIVESGTYDAEFERQLISLHHDRLPKLDEYGLVAYDRDSNVVAYDGYSTTDHDWLEFEMIDELLARFSTDETVDSVGVIEGRENVYDAGRKLADEADHELFLMYASDDLLDEGCMPQAKNAIERGIDFSVGSQNPAVREFFRRHLPGATIWEPQLDWLNDPSDYPRVDRLIVADRETVIFGLLDEPEDGAATETAMIGRGAANPLVVLVRELLGPRLDHLDYQSERFLSELPRDV